MCIEKIIPQLVNYGVTILSGLALGCDAYTQKVALKVGGKVIAVLPGSVDEVYPKTNIPLATAILENQGLLISEYPPGTNILKHNFLRRNRIVSGLSHGVLVIEATKRSGTLSTVNHALNQGREVMAIPGDIDRLGSSGTNQFIKAGAHLVETSEDVLAIMGWDSTSRDSREVVKGDNADEQAVLDLINSGHHQLTDLNQRSGLPTPTLISTISMLEISGKIFNSGDEKWHLR